VKRPFGTGIYGAPEMSMRDNISTQLSHFINPSQFML